MKKLKKYTPGGTFNYVPPINKNQMSSDNTRVVPTYLEKPDPVKVKEYLATKKKIEEKKKLEDAAIVQRRKDVAKQAKEDILNLKFTKAVAEDFSNNYRFFPNDPNSFIDEYLNPFQKSFNPGGKILENFASDAGPINPYEVAMDALPIGLELLGAKGVGKIFSPVTKAISPITKPIAKFASGVKSYGKDLGYSLKNSGALPTYKNTTRWSPDVVPEFLKQDGKVLTKQQKELTGSWYTQNPQDQLGFYMQTRPGAGNVNVLRMSERQIKELENAMPEYAKGMSGKTTSLNTADNFLNGELVVPPSMRANAKSFRFDVNPSDYVVPNGIDPNSNYGRSIIGNFTNEVLNSNYRNIAGVPRKYFPFEEGGPYQPETPTNWVEPKYVAGTNKDGHTGYDGVDTIYYDPNSKWENINNPQWLEHEKYHHFQNLNGRSHVGTPMQRPGQNASDEEMAAYYNRRNFDLQNSMSNMINQSPELQFVPQDILQRGVYQNQNHIPGYEDLMYQDPNTLEGEARQYEDYVGSGGKSIFTPQYADGGGNFKTYANGGQAELEEIDPVIESYSEKIRSQAKLNSLISKMAKDNFDWTNRSLPEVQQYLYNIQIPALQSVVQEFGLLKPQNLVNILGVQNTSMNGMLDYGY